MQNKTNQGQKAESGVSCLKQGSEMRSFYLKQGRGLKASAAHLYPNFPWVPPPPGIALHTFKGETFWSFDVLIGH